MNTLILDFLNSYADNPNPQYARDAEKENGDVAKLIL